MDIKPSVGIIILKEDSVLLVKHGPGSMHLQADFGLPSGKVEMGESEKQAAVRELFEETGLTTAEESLVEFPKNYFVANLKLKDGSNNKWGWRVFICKNYSGSLKGSSETEPMWISIKELATLSPMMPNVPAVVTSAINFLKQ